MTPILTQMGHLAPLTDSYLRYFLDCDLTETSRSYSFEMLSRAAANVTIHWDKINSAFKVEAETAMAASGKRPADKKNRQDLQIYSGSISLKINPDEFGKFCLFLL